MWRAFSCLIPSARKHDATRMRQIMRFAFTPYDLCPFKLLDTLHAWPVTDKNVRQNCRVYILIPFHVFYLVPTPNNADVIVVLGGDFLVLKLIHPLPPATLSPETSSVLLV